MRCQESQKGNEYNCGNELRKQSHILADNLDTHTGVNHCQMPTAEYHPNMAVIGYGCPEPKYYTFRRVKKTLLTVTARRIGSVDQSCLHKRVFEVDICIG